MDSSSPAQIIVTSAARPPPSSSRTTYSFNESESSSLIPVTTPYLSPTTPLSLQETQPPQFENGASASTTYLSNLQHKIEEAVIMPELENESLDFIPRPSTRAIFNPGVLSTLARFVRDGISPNSDQKLGEFDKLLQHNVFTTAILIRLRCDVKFIRERLERYPNMDKDLPMARDKCLQVWGDLGNLFFSSQSIFLPFEIYEGVRNVMTTGQRAPFTAKYYGSGAHAIVRESTIYPGGWIDRDGKPNAEKKIFALKVYKGVNKDDRKAAWRQEMKLLDKTEKSQAQNVNIVKSFGSLETPQECGIFFEQAQTDLAAFLISDTTHPWVVLLESAAGLCMGLDHFHQGYTCRGRTLRMLHRDLRPANILLIGSLWKLCDVGRARIVKSSNRDEIRLLQGTLTVDDDSVTGGTYTAPESGSSVKGEIFSLGAILLEVVVFAEGGTDGLNTFRRQRCQGFDHDRFWIEESGTKNINPNVLQYVKNFESRKAEIEDGDAMAGLLEFLMKEVLVVGIGKRTTARKIAQRLYSIAMVMVSHETGDAQSFSSFGYTDSSEHSSSTRSTRQPPSKSVDDDAGVPQGTPSGAEYHFPPPSLLTQGSAAYEPSMTTIRPSPGSPGVERSILCQDSVNLIEVQTHESNINFQDQRITIRYLVRERCRSYRRKFIRVFSRRQTS